MHEPDISIFIDAYEHALHHHQCAEALLYLNKIAQSIYEALISDPWLYRDRGDQQPDDVIIPLIVSWTNRIKECCSPGDEPFPSDDAAHVIYQYGAEWNEQPDDGGVLVGLITCLGRPVAGLEGCMKLLHDLTDPSRAIEQEIAPLIRLTHLLVHVWEVGRDYARENYPDFLGE